MLSVNHMFPFLNLLYNNGEHSLGTYVLGTILCSFDGLTHLNLYNNSMKWTLSLTLFFIDEETDTG